MTRPGLTKDAALVSDLLKLLLKIRAKEAGVAAKLIARSDELEALAAGVNDLGGTLMNESISRAAGSEWGQELPPEAMEALIRSAGRVPRQRTTTYGTPAEAQVRRSFGAAPLAEALNPPVRDAGLRRPERLLRPAALGV